MAGTVDYYAQLRSERAVERADVAIVVCDAAEGVTAEDLRVAEMAMKAGCATLLALNKWDIDHAPTSTTPAPGSSASCACGRTSSPARRLAGATSPTCCRRRSSSPTAPPSGSRPPSSTASSPTSSPRRRRPRAAAAACASTTRPRSGERPPRIAIQVNDRSLITRDWAYHLENRLRETYGLEGVPLVIDFVPHMRGLAAARPESLAA